MSVPSSLKILYIGSLESAGNSYKRYETLKSMGYQVEGINTDGFIFGSIWMRFHFHLYLGPGIHALNKEVLRKAQSFRPDLIWVDNKPYIKSNTLRKIKSLFPEIKIINVITDDPFGKYYYAWRLIYNTFKYYDVHFVQREVNISELKRRGAKRVETCYRSFDPGFHRKLDNDSILLESYKTEVGFIGSYEEEREEYIAYLVQKGIPVSITGDGWTEGKYWSILKSHYKGPSVYGDEYVKSINGMDIALHFLRKANRDQQDSRTFEIPACGTFMIAERSHLHLQFFKEKEEVEYFTSKEELLEKVKYYLPRENLRNKIAQAGYDRCFNSGYFHKNRLHEILEKTFNSVPYETKKIKRVVAAIYIDPDFYPPTINALLNLANMAEEVSVITRNHARHDFPYPSNITLIKNGPLLSVLETEKKSVFSKFISFVKFNVSLWRNTSNENTELLILYDAIPLLSFYLIRLFLRRDIKVWYHNHDMPGTHLTRKFSIGWFSGRYEYNAMRYVHYFSLPSADRLRFYPKWNNLNHFYVIPNYPSLQVYPLLGNRLLQEEEIRVIYQGTIGEGHGLESMVELLAKKVLGKHIKLILKGSVRPEYKFKLNKLAEEMGVTDRLQWVSLGPYCELSSLTSSCHIGLALHLGNDNVRKTLGTASNKIYEYAASSLPVILFDNEQFRKYLDHYSWTFFSDGSAISLLACIERIMMDYTRYSSSARNAFELNLNYEKVFFPAFNSIRRDMIS